MPAPQRHPGPARLAEDPGPSPDAERHSNPAASCECHTPPPSGRARLCLRFAPRSSRPCRDPDPPEKPAHRGPRFEVLAVVEVAAIARHWTRGGGEARDPGRLSLGTCPRPSHLGTAGPCRGNCRIGGAAPWSWWRSCRCRKPAGVGPGAALGRSGRGVRMRDCG
jgi:hypothetical protein